jgi:beta-N-acetylhexosaminidase
MHRDGHRRAATPTIPRRRSGACPAVRDLSLRGQLAQTLFVGVDGSSAADVRRLIERDALPGGLFVAGSVTTVFREGTLRELAQRPVPPLVAVDDEGGRIQRIDALVGDLPSAERLGEQSSERIWAAAAVRGRQLAYFGVTMDFAPVVDIGGQPDDAVIGDRAFAGDVGGVVRAAGAFATGLRDAGILPTLKHFPGHGRAVGDSHEGRAVTPAWSTVEKIDVAPYRALLREGPVAVMVGHLHVPGLSRSRLPTSLDPTVYEYLRHDLGFNGLVVTDDLSRMRAVTDQLGIASAIRQALAAGADMPLAVVPGELDPLLDVLLADVAAGTLSKQRIAEAAGRVLSIKRCR